MPGVGKTTGSEREGGRERLVYKILTITAGSLSQLLHYWYGRHIVVTIRINWREGKEREGKEKGKGKKEDSQKVCYSLDLNAGYLAWQTAHGEEFFLRLLPILCP